ncbi:hypothetical protein [Streptomyces sp. NPDC004726]
MGMSNRAIGREIGRNDRLVKYVADGQKPGKNLVESLRGLVAQKGGDTSAVVPTAPRRTTASGAPARVRRRTRWASGRTVRVKAQAVKGGAKAIMARLIAAAAAGDRCAFTVTFGPKVQLSQSDGTPIPRDGKEQEAEIGNRGRGLLASDVLDQAGGDIVGWCVNHLIETNRLASPHTPIGLEIRVWTPR